MTRFFVGEANIVQRKIMPTKILSNEIFSATKNYVQNKNLNKQQILFSV